MLSEHRIAVAVPSRKCPSPAFCCRSDDVQHLFDAERFVLSPVHGGVTAIEGRTALHHCDVPLCVKAVHGAQSHLRLGRRPDNMADRAMKGRHPMLTTLRWRWLTRARKAARS